MEIVAVKASPLNKISEILSSGISGKIQGETLKGILKAVHIHRVSKEIQYFLKSLKYVRGNINLDFYPKEL